MDATKRTLETAKEVLRLIEHLSDAQSSASRLYLVLSDEEPKAFALNLSRHLASLELQVEAELARSQVAEVAS